VGNPIPQAPVVSEKKHFWVVLVY